MKVKELIKELEKMDTEMEVCRADSEIGDCLIKSVEAKGHDCSPSVFYAIIR